MAGPLKTLFQALGASAYLAGVTLDFGEERIAAEFDAPTPSSPRIVMVPRRGAHSEPGYAVDGSGGPTDILTKAPQIDYMTDDLWEVAEEVQFYLWAVSSSGTPIDNADAVETLRLALLSALRDQRSQSDGQGNTARGLSWKSRGEEWETMQNAVNRFGRALVVTVQIDVPVVMAPPTSSEVTVQTTQFNPVVDPNLTQG